MSTNDTNSTAAGPQRATTAVFVAGLLVALGAAAATAHGLFEVAVASGVPWQIAWIYPLITDGLAIVAYAATSRLPKQGRRYAWGVVILAAGLSGLAQAVYLAGGVARTAGTASAADGLLRFGVGAWPAVAAAIVAHLLFMLATDRPAGTADAASGGTLANAPENPSTAEPAVPVVAAASVQRPAVQSPDVQPGPVQSPGSDASTGAAAGERTADEPQSVQPEPSSADAAEPVKPERSAAPVSSPKKDRARAEARRFQIHAGRLPTVDELMKLADVSRGTAGTALQELRNQPAALQLITDHSTQQANS
ncbi:DUF2637 domain-containing protein [Amycolatopsis echigonensis]|uniref:DUF2637 domain-containing protein n=1 Tax=Amycolatopsis echigonensis TaxID=2576905 RepID=A0A8E1VZQ8_9PSEU|nr:DUF2637 domain-containing protein [Amycolatopsis echigonensis]MBB2501186.1 DUF2637 domain-containing protein [Amycolatopsis echigonensis]